MMSKDIICALFILGMVVMWGLIIPLIVAIIRRIEK